MTDEQKAKLKVALSMAEKLLVELGLTLDTMGSESKNEEQKKAFYLASGHVLTAKHHILRACELYNERVEKPS